MLALSHETGPSVLQIRATNVLPQVVGNLVIAAFQQHEVELQTGALVIVDTRKSRVRILPLKT